MPTRLLFSDVDGTLLGSDGIYAVSAAEWSVVRPRLDLVLASSRTVLELSRNQRDLGVEGPVVAENGAVVAWPACEALSGVGELEVIDGRPWRVVLLGEAATTMRREVQEVARAMEVPYVDQLDVEPTLGRRCSVLLRPVPGRSFASLEPLAEELRHRGRSVASGGSWLAVTGEADKGVGARAIQAAWPLLGRTHALVAAVGDSDNDVPLLAFAERRFVIADDDGSWHPALRALPGAECVSTPGIAGWRDVIRALTVPEEE